MFQRLYQCNIYDTPLVANGIVQLNFNSVWANSRHELPQDKIIKQHCPHLSQVYQWKMSPAMKHILRKGVERYIRARFTCSGLSARLSCDQWVQSKSSHMNAKGWALCWWINKGQKQSIFGGPSTLTHLWWVWFVNITLVFLFQEHMHETLSY